MEFDDGYTAANGALVAQDDTVRPDQTQAFIAPIEPDDQPGDGKRFDLNSGNKNPWPSFSPDGRKIAYAGLAPDPTWKNSFVRDHETNMDREIYPSADASLSCQFRYTSRS